MKKIIKITEILPVMSGTDRNGNPWKHIVFAGESTYDTFPQKYAFETFKEEIVDKVEKLKTGDMVEVDFRINCRRNENIKDGTAYVRYYTSLQSVDVSVITFKKEGENDNN